jgi:hypothetical protein
MIDESKSEDNGIAAVLIERFEKWILPRALEMKAKVDRGERLDDVDVDFLENELRTAHIIKYRVDRSPEYQTLYARVVSLYEEITEKGLENEKAGNEPSATS